jgi:hypothetical protein
MVLDGTLADAKVRDAIAERAPLVNILSLPFSRTTRRRKAP